MSVTIFLSQYLRVFLPFLIGSFGKLQRAPPESLSLKLSGVHSQGHPGTADLWLPALTPAALFYLPMPFTCRLSLT